MAKYSLSYDILFAPRFKVLRHLLLITALAIIAFNHIFQEFQQYGSVLGNSIYLLGSAFWGLYLAAVYFNLYVLIPGFLLKKKYVLYLVVFFLLMLLLLAGKLFTEWAGFSLMNSRLTYAQTNIYDNISYFVLNTICIAGISMTVLLKQWTEDDLRINRLESELLQSEVDRLKEQINPHFLFDILNTASVLAKTNAEKASNIQFRLSELLRYELYDCNREKVFLNADIQFITNYLELEQLYADDFKYSLHVEGKTEHLLISPLLLIPLVQKTLMKIRDQNKHAALHIALNIDNNNIRFGCRADDITLSETDFSMVEQRLRILYKEACRLFVTEDTVELQLILSSHVR